MSLRLRFPARTVTAATALLAAALLAVALVPTAAAAAPTGSAASRPVSFAGVTVSVPASWPVIDVAGVPGCVRYDRSAVYLGSPSESTCPAGVIGRTATVQILPAGARPTGVRPVVRADTAGDLTVSESGTARVLVTADPDDTALAPAIVAGTDIDGATVGSAAVTQARSAATAAAPAAPATPHLAPRVSPQASPPASPGASTQAVPAPATFTGKAFDACSAPSLTQIDAWQSSPYGALGVYIGGVNRGCAQPALTPGWVSGVQARGWHLLPIYVGLQAPCSGFSKSKSISTNLTTAKSQGTSAANDAAAQMSALGLSTGNPVYLDMESWNDSDTGSCTAATMAFTDAWTVGLHAKGYTSGFYSSVSTGITYLVYTVQHQSTFHAPDAVWFAKWGTSGSLATLPIPDSAIPSTLWPNHQRVKQFDGPHNETYGGRTINIDSDAVDGPVTAAPFGLSAGAVPTVVPGRPYSVQLYTRGGTPPYTFHITSGSLPKDLTLSTSGVISGTTAAVTSGSPVTITVTDKTGTAATGELMVVSTYTDVATTDQFFSNIAWLANDGVTGGYPDGTFRPTTAVSRQSMAAFLYRYDHGGEHASNKNCAAPFPDVLAGSQFCGAITWLASTGITGGNGSGAFGPQQAVSRQAMAAFLYRYDHGGEHASNKNCAAPFPDVPAGSQFCGAITWLASTGITGGNGSGGFGPLQAVSRQAMAAFLYRLDNLTHP